MPLRHLVPVAAATVLMLPAAAEAAGTATALPPVKRALKAGKASKTTTCMAPGARRGVARTTYRVPMSGYLTVRLKARRGDWDLAVFKGTERGLGASQGFKAREVVQGWVTAGDELTVQGCRRAGRAKRATVSMTLWDAARPAAGDTPKLVQVQVSGAEDLERLESIGADVTHKVIAGAADVLVSGQDQLAEIQRAGYRTETLVDDLAEHFATSRRADARAAAASAGGSSLPSGRETYRNYEDFGAELKALADQHPKLVKPVTIGRSYQGRELQGVEIANGVDSTDGRPTYLVVALHHAREWPSAEAAMEFAHMLVDQRTDKRVKRVLDTTRTVIVPLINPDGYIAARRAAPVDPASNLSDEGINPGGLPLFGDLTTLEGVAPPGGILSYRRKNCAGDIPDPSAPCELQWGVDPNRNYGEGWGGAGSSGQPFSQSYHGPGPWSEPETQAVHEFSQSRQVTMIMTIHNVAALVLRPPGRSDGGNAPDEPRLKEIGDAIADAAGYTSQFGFQLYDTAGTTEDWNYAAQGAYGYTIEIGPKNGEFHMPYQVGVIDQWTGAYAGNGKGLREGLLIAGTVAGNEKDHSVISGTAPKGATLRLTKAFQTFTSPYCKRATGGAPFNVERCTDGPYPAMAIDDGLETTIEVPANGKFKWHVNPSTRPFVGAFAKIELGQTPARSIALEREEVTSPNPGLPVVAADDTEEKRFSIAAAEDIAKLDLLFRSGPDDDYDLELYYDRNGTLEEVGSSGKGAGEDERITLTYPEAGDYVLHVKNYAASGPWTATVDLFKGEFVRTDTGKREAWTLTCERGGEVRQTREVVVERGQRADFSLRCR